MGEIDSKEKLIELMSQHKNLVFSVCLKMTGDYFAAEDITQETFISAYDFLAENYKEIFKARYVLPHLRHKWEKLGIDCNRFRTHIQVIFERKKNNV